MDFSTIKHVGELRKLPISVLSKECKRIGLCEQRINKARAIILLCERYGLPTTGVYDPSVSKPRYDDGLTEDELKFYSTLSMATLEKISGWTKDIRRIPEIDIGHVKQYLLLDGHGGGDNDDKPVYTKEILRTYKTCRSWKHMEAGNLHSVAFNPLDNNVKFCVVRASCLPSQSTLPEDVKWLHVILDKDSGQPYGGYCTCTVGAGQACSHVGALMFLLSDIVAQGYHNLPDDPTCTETLCKWTEAKTSDIDPVQLEMVFLEQNSCSNASSTLPTPSGSKRLFSELDDNIHHQRLLQLRFELDNEAQRLGFRLPIQNILETNSSVTAVSISPLPDEGGDFDIPVCSEEIATEQPPSLAQIVSKSVDSTADSEYNDVKMKFLGSLLLCDADRQTIGELCDGQSSNKLWIHYKKGCISGSNVNRVARFVRAGHSAPDNLIKDIMFYNKPFSNLAMQYGLQHEVDGINCLAGFLTKSGHRNVKINRPGLVVHRDYAFIRGSPDAVITCDCCKMSHLCEIKCPYKGRYRSVRDLVDQGELDYLCVEDDSIKLKINVRGYFDQIQLLMAVCETVQAYLVVWTTASFEIIAVPFESYYWEHEILPHVKHFFEEFVVAELITRRVERGLPLMLCEQNVPTSGSRHSDEAEPASVTAVCHNKQCHDVAAPRNIKGKFLTCSANLVCAPKSRFHYFFEGFQRSIQSRTLNKAYVCVACRSVHPRCAKLQLSKGFI